MRYLQLTAAQWEALSWDLQETYLAGLAEDPQVPFSFSDDMPAAPGSGFPEGMQPVIRKADTGAEVFDIRGMIDQLEADPEARKRQ